MRSEQLRRIAAATITLFITIPCDLRRPQTDGLEVQSTLGASDGVEVTGDVFVVASDEGNVLCFYSWASPDLAIASETALSSLGGGGQETDIEVAARHSGAGSLTSGSSCLTHGRRRVTDLVE